MANRPGPISRTGLVVHENSVFIALPATTDPATGDLGLGMPRVGSSTLTSARRTGYSGRLPTVSVRRYRGPDPGYRGPDPARFVLFCRFTGVQGRSRPQKHFQPNATTAFERELARWFTRGGHMPVGCGGVEQVCSRKLLTERRCLPRFVRRRKQGRALESTKAAALKKAGHDGSRGILRAGVLVWFCRPGYMSISYWVRDRRKKEGQP